VFVGSLVAGYAATELLLADRDFGPRRWRLWLFLAGPWCRDGHNWLVFFHGG